MLLETTNSRGIVIAENNDNAATYLQQGFRGVVFRSVTGPALIECVRRVAAGDTWLPTQSVPPESIEEDLVGARVRDRLTPKEMRIVALIVQGCKNREIAIRLKTTEQVIKNYLRSIYDKTGVGDRLELALFTIHHRVLAKAAAEVGSKLDAENQSANQAASQTAPASWRKASQNPRAADRIPTQSLQETFSDARCGPVMALVRQVA